MANLSNINNKFLVTTTGEVLVSETGAAGAGKLWVKNDSSSYTRIANFYNTTDNSIPYITVGNQAAEGADSCVVFAFADSTTDANKFGWIGMAGDGVGTGIHWKRGGNVGIGTVSPGAKLTIADPGGNTTRSIQIEGNNSVSGMNGTIGYFSNALYISNNYYYNSAQVHPISTYGQTNIVQQTSTVTGGNFIDFNVSDHTDPNNAPDTRMRILDSGNVGIGVTVPGARLELDNPSAFTNMIEYGNVAWNQSTGHGLVAVNRGSDGYVQLQITSGVDNADVFTIRNSGTGANIQHNFLSNGNAYHAGNVGIGVAADTSVRTFIKGSDDGTNNFQILTRNSSGTNILAVRNDGKVGIGTSSNLSGPLTVQSDGGANCLHLNGRNNGTNDEAVISFYEFDGTTRNVYIIKEAGNLAFATGTGGSATEKFRIRSTGSLFGSHESVAGIVTGLQLMNPINTAGTGHGTSILLHCTNGDPNRGVKIASSSTSNYAIDNDMLFYTSAGSTLTEKMRITSRGQIYNAASVSATKNTFYGTNAGYSLSSGSSNTIFGSEAGASISGGTGNTVMGALAGQYISNGLNNTVIGTNSGNNITSGSRNTSVGKEALFAVIGGDNNTAIGQSAGSNITSGFNNTCLGFDADTPSNSSTNTVVLGNTLVQSLRCQVALTVVSDKRDKTNFDKIPHGLDFVDKLKPTSFEFKKEGKRDAKESDGIKRYGFIAQDILELEGNDSVIIDNSYEDKLTYTESNLIPVLVKAIQELKADNDSLKARIETLENN